MKVEFAFDKLALPDFRDLDVRAVDAFMDIVAAAHMLDKRDECLDFKIYSVAEIERRIDDGFEAMGQIYSRAPSYRFSYQRYLHTLDLDCQAKEESDEDILPLLFMYTRFLNLIEVSKGMSDILKRFKEKRWLEWTVLQPQRAFFMELAGRFLQEAERMFRKNGELDSEVAERVAHTSYVFKIVLPEDFAAYVYFLTCEDPDGYDAKRWTDNEENSQLQ